MNPVLSTRNRRLVPRWRGLVATLQSGELSHPARTTKNLRPTEPLSPDLLMYLERWRLSPSLVSAAELVEASIVSGHEQQAVDAARRIVSVDRTAAPLIRQQAARLLRRTGHEADIPADLEADNLPIAIVRPRSRLHRGDALAWVELALAQTIAGADRAAARSMLVALGLAPDNRHVLRSAARLYLHQDDPERAHATISRSAAAPSDPWLIASEIALAQVVRRSSKLIKIGESMLADSSWGPRQLTELAGAVGTQELISGNRKKSRRLFAQSLTDPTGSALAQGEWAASDLGGDIVSEARLSVTFENAEATAFHLARLGRFAEVAPACFSWSKQDPFSVRPYEFGTATSGYIEDFETALQFAKEGLKLRPDSPSLLNGAAFAAASLDRVDEAAAALAKISTMIADPTQRLVLLANRGLIAYRRGNVTMGERLYREVIDGFRRAEQPHLAARAKLYLAREAMIADAAGWRDLLKDASDGLKKSSDRESATSLALIEKRAAALQAERLPKPEPTELPTAVNPKMKVSVTFGRGTSTTLPTVKKC